MSEAQRTNRVIEIDRARLDEEQERILSRLEAGRGKILTPYKIWIHSAGVAEGMETLGTYLNTTDSVSEAEREIAILMTAVFWKSPFVINAHARHGRKAGLSEDTIDAMLASRQASFEDTRLQAIHDLARDALAGGSIDDGAFARYESALGRSGIALFVSLIGYFTSVSLAMRLHEVLPTA